MGHTPKRTSCVGLMLAAGFASRYGSDKRMACLADGTPLLVASMRAAQAVLDEVLLVLRPEDDLQALGLTGSERVARCVQAEQGMGHSLVCGVDAISRYSSAQALVILLADMPWIRGDTMAALLGAASSERIVVPLYRGQRGHPVVFGRHFWPDLACMEGDQGARGVILDNPQALVHLSVDDPGVILDVDTPEALTEPANTP